MAIIWALMHDNRELAVIEGARNDICREDCEIEAIERGLAVRLPAGLAFVRGVEIVCYENED